MLDERYFDMLTAKLPVIGVYDPESYGLSDFEAEIYVDLDKVVGLSARKYDEHDIFVVSVLTSGKNGHGVVNFVTNELAYDMLTSLLT